MKKIFNLPLLLIILLVSFTFIGCSDDEDEITTNNIVGTWKSTHWLTDEDINDGSFFGTGDLYIRFNADGTCVQVNIYDDYIVDGEVAYEGEIDILKGTWALSEDKLTLTEDGISVTFDILKLTEDELTLGGLLTMPYVRVSDSEINQYLNE